MGIKFSDNALTTLNANIAIGATTLTVPAGKGDNFPAITGSGTPGTAVDYFYVTMENASGQRELIKCEHRPLGTDTLGSGGYPLIRGAYGTTARAWVAGDSVDLRLPSQVLLNEVLVGLLKTGDTMTGALIMSGAPINTAQGADIASASTVNLDSASGNCPTITGTTQINAITLSAGRERWVRMAGALTIANSGTLVLNGGNIVTAAGDYLCFQGFAAGVVYLKHHYRQSSAVATLTRTETLTNKTLTNPAYTRQALSDSATVAWDMSLGTYATLTIAGNRTMALPTNLKDGSAILKLKQDATGSRTMTWNAAFKWSNGVAPVLSTGAGKTDAFSFIVDAVDGTLMGSYLPDAR